MTELRRRRPTHAAIHTLAAMGLMLVATAGTAAFRRQTPGHEQRAEGRIDQGACFTFTLG